MAGTYGDGTYGAASGDYGPNFGGVAATPIVGSEAYALTEQTLIVVVSPGAAESLLNSETKALIASLDKVDLFSITEATSIAPTLYIPVVDAWSLIESASAAQQLGLTASDLFTLSVEAADVIQIVALSVTDPYALVEATAVVIASAAAMDSATLTEGSPSLTDSLTASDSLAASELSAIVGQLVGSEGYALSEAATAIETLAVAVSEAITMIELADLVGQATFSLSDTASLVENVQALNVAAANADSSTLAEAVSSAAALSIAETHNLTDLAEASELRDLSLSDLFTLASEIAQTAISYSRVDSGMLSETAPRIDLSTAESLNVLESLSLAATVLANDAYTLALEAATAGEHQDVSAADSFAISESLSLASMLFIEAADSLSLDEAYALIADLSVGDTALLVDLFEELSARFDTADNFAAAETSAIAAQIAASEDFSATDFSLLDTAAFTQVLGAIATAAATIRSMTSAQSTMGAGSARADMTGQDSATADVDGEGAASL